MENPNHNIYAVVTGAGKGIGRAIATALAGKGFTVIACARTQADLDTLKSEYILTFAADLSTKQGVSQLEHFVKDTCTVPDVIVNNVGIYRLDSIPDGNAAVLEELLQVNLWAGYRLTVPFIKPMVDKGAGHIINICSKASLEAKDYASSYSISKHAQLGYSRNLANDLKGTGVKVTAILPGNVNTPSWEGYEGDKSGFLQPHDVAQAVVDAIYAGSSSEVVLEDKC